MTAEKNAKWEESIRERELGSAKRSVTVRRLEKKLNKVNAELERKTNWVKDTLSLGQQKLGLQDEYLKYLEEELMRGKMLAEEKIKEQKFEITGLVEHLREQLREGEEEIRMQAKLVKVAEGELKQVKEEERKIEEPAAREKLMLFEGTKEVEQLRGLLEMYRK